MQSAEINWHFFNLLGLVEKHQIIADEIDSSLVLKTAKTDETSQDENVKNTGKYTRQWTVDATNTTPLRKSRRTSATSTDSADSISPVRRIKRKSQIVAATQIVASKEGTIVLEEKNPETPSKRRGRPPKVSTEIVASKEDTVLSEEKTPGTPSKRRGRPPKVSTETVASKEDKVLLEEKTPGTPSKRRGRPPKSATETKGT